MFSQACVKTSVHRRGLPQCMLGYTSPSVRHPEVSASVHAGIYPPVKHPLVRHPPSDTISPGQTPPPLVRHAIPWSDKPSPGHTPPPLIRHPSPAQTPPWSDTCLLGRHPPGQTPPLGRHHPLVRHPPPPTSHCSGRYASYWNTFLVLISPSKTNNTASLLGRFRTKDTNI